jgi:rare lipoprotein A (peptidoglycan hydrolase)
MSNVKAQGIASWYGPGFYGNRTADGTVLKETVFG